MAGRAGAVVGARRRARSRARHGGRGYDRDPEKMVDTVETVDTLRSLCLDGVIINGERLSEISMTNYVIPIRWNELMNFVSRLSFRAF